MKITLANNLTKYLNWHADLKIAVRFFFFYYDITLQMSNTDIFEEDGDPIT